MFKEILTYSNTAILIKAMFNRQTNNCAKFLVRAASKVKFDCIVR